MVSNLQARNVFTWGSIAKVQKWYQIYDGVSVAKLLIHRDFSRMVSKLRRIPLRNCKVTAIYRFFDREIAKFIQIGIKFKGGVLAESTGGRSPKLQTWYQITGGSIARFQNWY